MNDVTLLIVGHFLYIEACRVFLDRSLATYHNYSYETMSIAIKPFNDIPFYMNSFICPILTIKRLVSIYYNNPIQLTKVLTFISDSCHLTQFATHFRINFQIFILVHGKHSNKLLTTFQVVLDTVSPRFSVRRLILN